MKAQINDTEFSEHFTRDKDGFYIQKEVPDLGPLTDERIAQSIHSLLNDDKQHEAEG